jgi:hypothetical protein
MLLTGGVGAGLQGGPSPEAPPAPPDSAAVSEAALAAEVDRLSRRLLDAVARHQEDRRRRQAAEAAEIAAFGERLAALRPLIEVRLPAAAPPVPPLLWQDSCRRRLVALAVGFTPVGDARNARGCGLADAVRVERLSSAGRSPGSTISAPMPAAPSPGPATRSASTPSPTPSTSPA